MPNLEKGGLISISHHAAPDVLEADVNSSQQPEEASQRQ